MKPLNRFLNILCRCLGAVLLVSCAGPAIERQETTVPRQEDVSPPLPSSHGGDLLGKMYWLQKASGFVATGNIVLRSASGAKEGNFTLSIEGENMSMEISAKGFKAGEILLKDSRVSMNPRLKDEYLEYMFAVILRDSVTWWNIAGYQLASYEAYYLMRNSWKKIYINREHLIPGRQVFRLMHFKSVDVQYASARDYGFATLPSKIQFSYEGYECFLEIDGMTLHDGLRESEVRDQSPLF